MTDKNKINQTHLIIAAVSASFAKAFDKHYPGFKVDFLQEIESHQYTFRESSSDFEEAEEVLSWINEILSK